MMMNIEVIIHERTSLSNNVFVSTDLLTCSLQSNSLAPNQGNLFHNPHALAI